MQNNSKEFKKLQKTWYAKLKRSGFDDIEQDEHRLKAWHSFYFKVHSHPNSTSAKEEYYRYAGQFLHDHEFKSEFIKMIWEYHAEGKSIREIVDILTKKKIPTSRPTIHKMIQGLAKIMVAKCLKKPT